MAGNGFSLIELMVVVAIIGILAAIAIPSYQGAVRNGNRGDAQAFMMDVAQREQQIFLDSRSYRAVANNADFASINLSVPQRLGGLYDFKVELKDLAGNDPPPPVFRVVATAKNAQAADGELMLDSRGARSPSNKW